MIRPDVAFIPLAWVELAAWNGPMKVISYRVQLNRRRRSDRGRIIQPQIPSVRVPQRAAGVRTKWV